MKSRSRRRSVDGEKEQSLLNNFSCASLNALTPSEVLYPVLGGKRITSNASYVIR